MSDKTARALHDDDNENARNGAIDPARAEGAGEELAQVHYLSPTTPTTPTSSTDARAVSPASPTGEVLEGRVVTAEEYRGMTARGAVVKLRTGSVVTGRVVATVATHPLPGTPLADWSIDTAITLPIGVETYAAYALHVWLSGHRLPATARRFAKWSAIGSLILGGRRAGRLPPDGGRRGSACALAHHDRRGVPTGRRPGDGRRPRAPRPRRAWPWSGRWQRRGPRAPR